MRSSLKDVLQCTWTLWTFQQNVVTNFHSHLENRSIYRFVLFIKRTLHGWCWKINIDCIYTQHHIIYS
jgi:hypothetical protein